MQPRLDGFSPATQMNADQPAPRPIAPRPTAPAPTQAPVQRVPRIAFVTAGPTEEPIDSVRFLGNRSSGQMGLAIAAALRARGMSVVLALGPIRTEVPAGLRDDPQVRLERFRTASDLEQLMLRELPNADLVVMAAAVADFRPTLKCEGKLRRTEGGMSLALEGVPDLLSSTRASRKPGARVIGFALEPREALERSAREKLERKDLAGIVANPLETMDAPDVDGALFLRDGTVRSPGGRLSKPAFADWLAGECT